MNIDQFEELALRRAAVRSFSPDPVSRELLERLLKITQRTPSAFNLQPVHYYVIKKREVKESLVDTCLGQRQILNAQALVVFAADRDVVLHHFEKVWEGDLRLGVVKEDQREFYQKFVDMSFSTKPMGCGWISKAFLAPIFRFFTPIPELPAVHKRCWLDRHVGLSAMMFMLAAESAGLASCPISAFDERRLKRILKIPRRFIAPLIVAVGYPTQRPPSKSRLPLEEIIHWS